MDSLPKPLFKSCLHYIESELLEGRNPALAASLSSISEIALDTFPSLSNASEPWCSERPQSWLHGPRDINTDYLSVLTYRLGLTYPLGLTDQTYPFGLQVRPGLVFQCPICDLL